MHGAKTSLVPGKKANGIFVEDGRLFFPCASHGGWNSMADPSGHQGFDPGARSRACLLFHFFLSLADYQCQRPGALLRWTPAPSSCPSGRRRSSTANWPAPQ